ncbi:MAG: hypothetical protein JW782_03080 [Candidatus Saganbacteria bacterium]|nr:hypothetical protein [Candidatus Saganbacteria bacterium]
MIIKRTNLVLLLIVLTAIAAAAAERLTYHSWEKGQLTTSETTVKRTAEGYLFEGYSWAGQSITRTDAEFNTLLVEMFRPGRPERITLKRKGNIINFKGPWKGEQINEDIKVDSTPWLSSPFLLIDFIRSEDKEKKFYMILIHDQSATKFKAIKEGSEEIEVNGIKTRALKVKVTLDDWRGMFWSSYYWFRPSDGIMVRSKETRGPPGTPETLVELAKEVEE